MRPSRSPTTKARSCWSFRSPRPSRHARTINPATQALIRDHSLRDRQHAPNADVSDCASAEKYQRLRSGKPPAPASCLPARGNKASARENVHDELFVRAAQPVAGRCFLRCIHIWCCRAATRRIAARRGAAPPARRAAPLPPGSPLIGRPADNEAAAKLAPIAPPPIPAAADKLPTAKLKVPPGFNIEVYAAGIANARSLVEGDKGTVFVGTPPGRQRLCHHQQGRQALGEDASPRASTGRTASPSRTARSTSPNCRRSPRSTRSRTISTARQADDDLRQAAEGRSPWLEVHRHRPRQQALHSGRAARQQRAA